MSRYPGSQFIVIDNTATTATVPVTTKNPAAPTYMTSFHSIKGPEEIKTVYGNDFYDLYGSQSKILFSTYGFTSFNLAISCLISIRFDTVRPSGSQVVQVSVKWQAHWIKCKSL